MSELLPCPFCGSKAMVDDDIDENGGAYFIGCSNSHCIAEISSIGVSFQYPEQAIEAWNTRNEWISTETVNAMNRLSVMAVKHCPRHHHDWKKILSLVKVLNTVPPAPPKAITYCSYSDELSSINSALGKLNTRYADDLEQERVRLTERVKVLEGYFRNIRDTAICDADHMKNVAKKALEDSV